MRRSDSISCVKVQVDILGSPSLVVRTVSEDVKQHWRSDRARSCVNVEVDVLVSPSLIVRTVSA